MLHLYGLPPRLVFVQGGHANCKVEVGSLADTLLFIVVISPLLPLAKKILIFRSLTLMLHIANTRQFILCNM
ncbi:Uncharacterised protein [Serratia quinivorans]|nr:Uncharacterised protein [Serratia quinivorans]